jgi:hypothetical protein
VRLSRSVIGVACTWRWKPRPRTAPRTRCGCRWAVVETVCGTWRAGPDGLVSWGVRPAGRLPAVPGGGSAGAGTCRRKGSRRDVLAPVGRVCFGVGSVLRRSRTGLLVPAGVGRRARRWTGASVAARIAVLPLRSRRVLVWLARPRAAIRSAAAWSRSSDRPHEQVAHRYPAMLPCGVLTCVTAPPQRGQPVDVPRAGTVTTAVPTFAARWAMAVNTLPRTAPDSRRLRLRDRPPASRVARFST